MRKIAILMTSVVLAVLSVLLGGSLVGSSMAQQPSATPQQTNITPFGLPPAAAPALSKLEDSLLEWRLAPEDQKYAAIDGKRLKEYVTDQTAISRRYRDSGHRLWGRIIGTESDAESIQWVMERFKKAGLSDVRVQPFDLTPQWLAESWSVTATGGEKTITFQSAHPAYLAPATPPGGLDLEVVYVGLGSEADYRGREVRGKAIVLFSMPQPDSLWNSAASEGAVERAVTKGAAAILEVVGAPGNFRMQFSRVDNKIPAFSLGYDEGDDLRDLIAAAPTGESVRVKIALNVKMASGLKTGSVWGTLPGATDETIYVVAHRDAWFEGANDNASGVATMVGLAEYFAKVPREQRRRTIVFIGTAGHHNAAAVSSAWLAAHKELFAKTALIINCEHTGGVQSYLRGPVIRKANHNDAFTWYVGGSRNLAETVMAGFRDFGVATYEQPERLAGGEMRPFYMHAPSLQLLQGGIYFHSDRDTDDTVTHTGLSAVTRAYAKIIDNTNKLAIEDLRAPAAASAAR